MIVPILFNSCIKKDKTPLKNALCILVCTGFILASCAGMPDENIIITGPEEETPGLSKVQRKLIEGAERLKGTRKLVVKDKTFSMDCSGTVLAVYYYAGIDLTGAYSKYSGNGVARIYKYLEDENLLYNTIMPVPGDIIFWDNTWDKNSDGKINDSLTHMGMVVYSFKNGDVEYIHLNYRKGIIFEKMNLKDPDTNIIIIDGKTIIINSPMRMRSAPKSGKRLASQLCRSFGMGYLLEK